VRDAISDAYGVRSAFAHGARLSSGQKSKFENRYGTPDGLVRVTLNFVRKAILISLLVTRTKKDLIRLIDDAFIERPAEDQLQQLLLPVSELV